MELKHTKKALLGKILWSDGERYLVWTQNLFHDCWLVELILGQSSRGHLVSITVLTLGSEQQGLTAHQEEIIKEVLSFLVISK